MQGDQQDMLSRLKQVLPLRWFPDDTPVLDTVLSGVALAWAWVYTLLQEAKAQTRIATAEDMWLDLIAMDYFGSQLLRRTGEDDTDYPVRIKLELVRERGTRQAVISSIVDLTARSPSLFEPANTLDTGGYGSLQKVAPTGLAYGCAGGWGNLDLPFQFFVTAYRPVGVGIGSVSGWGGPAGGYGDGSIEYADLEMMQAQVTDTNVCSAITSVLPVGTIAWTRISS